MYPTEKFDLIVKLEEYDKQTPHEQIMAIEQIERELKSQDPSFYIKESEFYNVYMVELKSDKLKTALKLAKASLNTVSEIVPIESVVATNPNIIIEKVINISKDKITDAESFMVKCNITDKRHLNSKEKLIQSIYHEMKKLNITPDENNPDWVVHIEVVGENTGISVLKAYYLRKTEL